MFYSKFIFRSGAETPSQTPTQSPDRKADQLGQRVQHNLDTKKAAAEKLKQDKAELLKRWKENNPESKEQVPDDPKAVAVNFISNTKRGKEAYLLMALIEENWKPNGKDDAWRLFKEAAKRKNKPGDIDFKPFEDFFSESNAGPKLGFYYWAKKDRWYAVDKDGDDESLRSSYLSDPICLERLKYEFGPNQPKDSGLSSEKEQLVLAAIGKHSTEGGKMVVEKESSRGKELVTSFFKKSAENKWAKLDEKTISKMNLLYGAGVGKYLFRYVPGKKPEKDRIYMVLINGKQPEKNLGSAGYIEIDDKGLGNWNAYDSADKLKGLIDKMEVEDIDKALGSEKLQAGETLSNKQMLDQTAHMISKIKGISQAYPTFHELDNYYSDITKKLTAELKTKKAITKNVDVIVKARVDDIKAKIEAIIAKDEDLKEARSKNSNEKLDIKVDYDDKVTFKFKKWSARNLFRLAREKAHKAESSVEAITKNKMTEVREKLKSKFGKIPLIGPLIQSFVEKFLKGGIPKLLSGGSAPITTMILGFLGVSITPALLGAKKYKAKDFEKMLGSLFKNDQMKEAEHKKKFTLTENYKLKGYTIIIPKGKGVFLKKGAELQTDSGVLKSEGPKKKGKMPWSGSSSEAVGKDQEIVIKDGTTIPAGTIITQMKVKRA